MREIHRTEAGPGADHESVAVGAYASRTLGDADAARVETHALVCDRCFAELVLAVIERGGLPEAVRRA